MTETTIRLEITHDKPLPPQFLYLVENFPEVFLDIEVWRLHPVLREYEISSLGNIRRLQGLVTRKDGGVTFVRGGPIRPGRLRTGYLNWNPSINGKHKSGTVHRAVLDTFFGEAPDLDGCHLNGVRDDNRLLNLRWGTKQENEADKVRHGTIQRGEKHGNSRLTEEQVAAIRADFRSCKVVAADYGISSNHVWKIRRGDAWKHSTQGVEAGVTATLVEVPKELGSKAE